MVDGSCTVEYQLLHVYVPAVRYANQCDNSYSRNAKQCIIGNAEQRTNRLKMLWVLSGQEVAGWNVRTVTNCRAWKAESGRKDWSAALPEICWSMNATWHHAIKTTPYELLFANSTGATIFHIVVESTISLQMKKYL